MPLCIDSVWEREAVRLLHAPSRYAAWLRDPSSLTQRVQAACSGRFRVAVLSQRWQSPSRSEARALHLRPGVRALVRQVCLMCDDAPWVYASTVIPRATLTGAQRRLARLHTRPLGAVLFADPTMRRGRAEIARLVRGDCLYAQAVATLAQPPAEIWARRSLFFLRDKPLLVTEAFLPAIPDAPARFGS
jgi:chorismate--pyruvate lyase